MDATSAVLLFIRDYLLVHVRPPSLREIARGCGFASHTSVVRHLDFLEEAGFIQREPSRARSVVLTERGQAYAATLFRADDA